ncbi:deoxyribonuclease-2-alpha [Megalops cyprinoides]|uniref:deoxyribonuclease-2-alpha n=1 Tax=Megalops cyprinoides TaxID=118141 RepID=UPI001863B0ED|nr:deoxyribonuclease-2-alpha [Megalops cyprinoides]
MFSLGLLFLLHVTAEGAISPISCYNDQGESVDWLYLYKLPHHSRSHAPRDEGLRYLLMGRGSEGWTEGAVLVNDSTGALGRTVGQLYEQNSEMAYVLYNDQKPRDGEETGARGVTNERGHTKGVVLVDKTQGFWLVHSTPHFPPMKESGKFEYPSSGVTNGQNFICVTYPVERFQTIGEQLQINEPLIYDCSVPESLASALPALAEVCGRSKREQGNASLSHSALLSSYPSNRSISLSSLGGTNFISFAKSASFANDLYHSWVAPALQSDLLVQFWRRTEGVLPSDCSQGWKVLNVETISLGEQVMFSSTLDHSKWAVSADPGAADGEGGWVCVGDINRNEAEEKRGGGTVCRRDATVWKAYRNAVQESYPCN